MRGSDNSSYTGASAAATHPSLSVSTHSPLPLVSKPGSREGERCGRRAGKWPGAPPPPSWHDGPRPATAAPRALPWHLAPGPTLLSWPGTARQRKKRGGVGGLGQEGSAELQELGKKGKELRGGSAALAQSLASGPATDWWRSGPEKPQTRDAPRPEQLEEQLCVRCGGVRIFLLAFGGFTYFLRFLRQGKRFRPAYCGVSLTRTG